MTRTFKVFFTPIFVIAASLSGMFYDNYKEANKDKARRVDSLDSVGSESIRLAGELELVIVEILQHSSEPHISLNLYRDAGVSLNKIAQERYSRQDWEKALETVDHSFPKKNISDLIKILACYKEYLVFLNSSTLDGDTHQVMTKLFDIRSSFFGPELAWQLFYSEWLLTGLEYSTNQFAKQLDFRYSCRLPDIL